MSPVEGVAVGVFGSGVTVGLGEGVGMGLGVGVGAGLGVGGVTSIVGDGDACSSLDSGVCVGSSLHAATNRIAASAEAIMAVPISLVPILLNITRIIRVPQ